MSHVTPSAQQVLHSDPVDIGVSSHRGLFELACCALGEEGFLISTFGLSLPAPGSPGLRGKYKSLTKLQLKWLNRCQAIEPLIGHTKADHGMQRCWLKGELGDALQALSCAAGYNIRWLLRAIAGKAAKDVKAFLLALLGMAVGARLAAGRAFQEFADERGWIINVRKCLNRSRPAHMTPLQSFQLMRT